MQNVLIMIAHPDDETIFGANELLDKTANRFVLCFTNAKHPVRNKEFFETLKIVQADGAMLDFHDAMDDNWSNLQNNEIIKHAVLPNIPDEKPDLIVSHDSNGEYGHVQHKRVHTIAKDLAEYLHVPFKGFHSTFQTHFQDPITRNSILNDVYKSQQGAINKHKNFYTAT